MENLVGGELRRRAAVREEVWPPGAAEDDQAADQEEMRASQFRLHPLGKTS